MAENCGAELRINSAKIDVQGMEIQVLAGMTAVAKNGGRNGSSKSIKKFRG